MTPQHRQRPPSSRELTLAATPRIPEGVLSQELAGETVLLNLNTSTYFGLDPMGTRMWQLVQEGRSLRAISDVLLQEYDVAPEVLTRDLFKLVRTLRDEGLLEDV